MKEFYSTKEFAELLSVHPRTVVKLIKSKKIRAVNISRGTKPVYRILCKEYLRFIAEEFEKGEINRFIAEEFEKGEGFEN